LTFPDNDHAITIPPEMGYAASVSTPVVVKLGDPKFPVGFWHCGFETACMMMPKAPVYKDGPAPGAIREIWTTGKLLDVLAIAEA